MEPNIKRGAGSALLLCCCLFLVRCNCAREDDIYEPNNSFAEATRIELDTPVEARANQDDPDVFVVAVSAASSVVFSLEHRDFENCPTFSVTGPGSELLLDEGDVECRYSGGASNSPPDVAVPGASVELLPPEGYTVRVPANADGDYFLTILEQGEADNIFPFSWDYRLTASIE